MNHNVNKLVKKLEDTGILIRRAGGTHLVARNPKTGVTTTLSFGHINKIGVENSLRKANKILLKSAA